MFLSLEKLRETNFSRLYFLSLPFRDRSCNTLPQHFGLIVAHNENKNPSAVSAYNYHQCTKKSTTENIGIKCGHAENTLVS